MHTYLCDKLLEGGPASSEIRLVSKKSCRARPCQRAAQKDADPGFEPGYSEGCSVRSESDMLTTTSISSSMSEFGRIEHVHEALLGFSVSF
jgi:hypothetical protein